MIINTQATNYYIPAEVFTYAETIKSIDNLSISTIASYVFMNNVNLRNIANSSVQTIQNSAFLNCSVLTTVSFPNAQYIGIYAFSSCTTLLSLYLSGSTVVSLPGGSATFSNTALVTNGTIYVPASLVSDYQNDANWSALSSRIKAGYALPTSYIALDYIECTGTQYISTNIYPSTNIGMQVIFEPSTAVGANPLAIMGCLSTTIPSAHCNIGVRNSTSPSENFINIDYAQGSFLKLGSFNTSTNTIYANYLNDKKGILNDTVVSTNITFVANNYKIMIGATNLNGTISRQFLGKLYHTIITQGTNEILNLVPCMRLSDNAIGMYDLCGSYSPFDNTSFYGNSGTGTFIGSRLYLYWYGQEYVEWSVGKDESGMGQGAIAQKNTTNIYLLGPTISQNGTASWTSTVNTIDVTQYKSLHVILANTDNGEHSEVSARGIQVGYPTSATSWSSTAAIDDGEITISLENISGSYKIRVYSGFKNTTYITAVWLE